MCLVLAWFYEIGFSASFRIPLKIFNFVGKSKPRSCMNLRTSVQGKCVTRIGSSVVQTISPIFMLHCAARVVTIRMELRRATGANVSLKSTPGRCGKLRATMRAFLRSNVSSWLSLFLKTKPVADNFALFRAIHQHPCIVFYNSLHLRYHCINPFLRIGPFHGLVKRYFCETNRLPPRKLLKTFLSLPLSSLYEVFLDLFLLRSVEYRSDFLIIGLNVNFFVLIIVFVEYTEFELPQYFGNFL